PHGTCGCTNRGGMEQLVKLDTPIRLLDGDNGVTKLDQVVLLHIEQFLPNFLCLCLRGEFDDDQITHRWSPAELDQCAPVRSNANLRRIVRKRLLCPARITCVPGIVARIAISTTPIDKERTP